MLDIASLALSALQHDIFPEVPSPEEAANYPSDTVYLSLCSIRVAFVIDIGYSDGSFQRLPVTRNHLDRWGVSEPDFFEIIRCEGSVTPVSEWVRVEGRGIVYQPPHFSRDWTYHLLDPTHLSSLDIKGKPLLMIPFSECALVTGHLDFAGREAMVGEAVSIAKPSDPITRTPMQWDGRDWREA